MMIRATSALLFAGGFMLWMMSKFIPFLQVISMDWVAWFMAFGGLFILLFVFGVSQLGLQYDTIPPGGAIINYIRRDGIIAPLLGRRIFPGESFLDVPRLGIVEDLGKDTVLLWGRKKVRFGVENINYTPDPHYFNLCRTLYNLGIDDSDDLRELMNIPLMKYDTVETMKHKVYYLSLMADVYWNMTHYEPHGANKLIDIFKKKRDRVTFGRRRHNKKQEADMLMSEIQKTKVEAQKNSIPIPVKEKKERTTEEIHKEMDRWLK